jgi:hypothetical protein
MTPEYIKTLEEENINLRDRLESILPLYEVSKKFFVVEQNISETGNISYKLLINPNFRTSDAPLTERDFQAFVSCGCQVEIIDNRNNIPGLSKPTQEDLDAINKVYNTLSFDNKYINGNGMEIDSSFF